MIVKPRWSSLALEAAIGIRGVLAFETAGGWTSETNEVYRRKDPAGGGRPTLRSGSCIEEGGYLLSKIVAYLPCPGTVAFDFAVQGEFNYTAFAWRSDDDDFQSKVAERRDQAAQNWEPKQIRANESVTWAYRKEEDAYVIGQDCAWLANLTWAPDALPVDTRLAAWKSLADGRLTVATGGAGEWFVATNHVAGECREPNGLSVTNLPHAHASRVSVTPPPGPGILTFTWKVNCEAGYIAEDGTYRYCDRLIFSDATGNDYGVRPIEGLMTSFATVTVTNTTDAAHVFTWRYVKDGGEAEGLDRAFLDSVEWTPLAESDGVTIAYTDALGFARSVTVPKTWVDEKGLLPSGSTDYRSALAAPSGKTGAGGAALPYWFDYLAGTDPADLSDVFRITSISVADGAVTLTWSPDLRDAVPPRAYRVLGKARLDDPAETWAPTNAASRFFRVEVQMK
jgi:hypothetical protein